MPCRREPREGSRLTLAATVDTPAGPCLFYSAHLEVFCGPIGRLKQFADVLQHSRAAAAAGITLQVRTFAALEIFVLFACCCAAACARSDCSLLREAFFASPWR